MSDFIACYHWADIVAVPMRQNIYSGITVALEAAAMGTPVVSSRTGGVPTYFGEDEVFYSPAGGLPSDARHCPFLGPRIATSASGTGSATISST